MFWTDIARHITVIGMIIGVIISMFTFGTDIFQTAIQLIFVVLIGTVVMVFVEISEGIHKANKNLEKLIENQQNNRSISGHIK